MSKCACGKHVALSAPLISGGIMHAPETPWDGIIPCEVATLHARVAEMEAALRDLTAECTDDPQEDDWLYQRAIDRARSALSRGDAEPAPPVRECERCVGRGRIRGKACPNCEGTGRRP